MSDSIDQLVKCPFWLYTTKNFIACEGYVNDTCMLTKFPDAISKKTHIELFCQKEDGGACPMAKSLYAKYED